MRGNAESCLSRRRTTAASRPYRMLPNSRLDICGVLRDSVDILPSTFRNRVPCCSAQAWSCSYRCSSRVETAVSPRCVLFDKDTEKRRAERLRRFITKAICQRTNKPRKGGWKDVGGKVDLREIAERPGGESLCISEGKRDRTNQVCLRGDSRPTPNSGRGHVCRSRHAREVVRETRRDKTGTNEEPVNASGRFFRSRASDGEGRLVFASARLSVAYSPTD